MEFRVLYRTVVYLSALMSMFRIGLNWSRESLLVLTRARVDEAPDSR